MRFYWFSWFSVFLCLFYTVLAPAISEATSNRCIKKPANITVLPEGVTTPPLTKQNSSASIVVLTPGERNEAVLRHILADVCQLTECSSLRNFTGLIKRSPDKPANLILVRSLLLHKDSKLLKNIIKCTQHHTPILVLSDETDKTHIAEYMQSGARDTVSLDEIEHLRAVVERELEEHRMRCAYRRAASSAAMYREQVKRLTGQAFRISSPAANITTRVTDRENFIELLAKGLTRSPARGVRALALIRPDRFTAVQESVGFMASEEALVHIASVLTNLLHPADLCGRIGGTVFAVYIERGTMEDAEAWVRQVCRTLPECPFERRKNGTPHLYRRPLRNHEFRRIDRQYLSRSTQGPCPWAPAG